MVALAGIVLAHSLSRVSVVKPDLTRLSKILDYTFTDKELLQKALTHRSASGNHNERLEFLGDSVLNFVIAKELFQRFPKAREGDLSRLRASLVKGETLAVIAQEIQLGDYLYLGSGELKSGGFRRNSILADGLEAVIGAVLLDSDFAQCESFILKLFENRLVDVKPHGNLKDPKSNLQELLQSRGKELPTYSVISVVGEPHDQMFEVECRVDSFEMISIGKGKSRRRAEQDAAGKVLISIMEKLNV